MQCKVTECEHDKRIEGWVAEDAEVLEAAAVFQKNGGFDRCNTCPVGGCQDPVCWHMRLTSDRMGQ